MDHPCSRNHACAFWPLLSARAASDRRKSSQTRTKLPCTTSCLKFRCGEHKKYELHPEPVSRRGGGGVRDLYLALCDEQRTCRSRLRPPLTSPLAGHQTPASATLPNSPSPASATTTPGHSLRQWHPEQSSRLQYSRQILPSSVVSAPALWIRAPTGSTSTSCKRAHKTHNGPVPLSSRALGAQGRSFRAQHHVRRTCRCQDQKACRPAHQSMWQGHFRLPHDGRRGSAPRDTPTVCGCHELIRSLALHSLGSG